MKPGTPPEDQVTVVVPHCHDVLLGRGGAVNSHEGNQQFRKWVRERKAAYNMATSKKGKAALVRQIVDLVRGLDPPGRFLRLIDSGPKQAPPSSGREKWVQVDEEKALTKTSQALREGAPDIRSAHGFGLYAPLATKEANVSSEIAETQDKETENQRTCKDKEMDHGLTLTSLLQRDLSTKQLTSSLQGDLSTKEISHSHDEEEAKSVQTDPSFIASLIKAEKRESSKNMESALRTSSEEPNDTKCNSGLMKTEEKGGSENEENHPSDPSDRQDNHQAKTVGEKCEISESDITNEVTEGRDQTQFPKISRKITETDSDRPSPPPKKRKFSVEYTGPEEGGQQEKLKSFSDICKLQQAAPSHGPAVSPLCGPDVSPPQFCTSPPSVGLPSGVSTASSFLTPNSSGINRNVGGLPSTGLSPSCYDTFLPSTSLAGANIAGYAGLGDSNSLSAAARSVGGRFDQALANAASTGLSPGALSSNILLDPFPALAQDYVSAYAAAAAAARQFAPPPDSLRLAKENAVRMWLERCLPHASTEDVTCYAMRLVDDGFDCIAMLENELLEEDLGFMKKAHKRILVRVKSLSSVGRGNEVTKEDGDKSESKMAAV